MHEAITPDLAGELDVALRGARRELAPARWLDENLDEPMHRAQIMVELGKYMRIAGGGWPPEQRQEWISGAEEELCDFPFLIVLESIRRARKKVRSAAAFVSWVVDDIEGDVGRLRLEEKHIRELREIARS